MSSKRTGRWLACLVGVLVTLPGLAGADGFEYAEDELPFSLNPLHETTMAETRLAELLFESLWGPGYDGTIQVNRNGDPVSPAINSFSPRSSGPFRPPPLPVRAMPLTIVP